MADPYLAIIRPIEHALPGLPDMPGGERLDAARAAFESAVAAGRARLEAIRGGHEIGGQLPDRSAAIREAARAAFESAVAAGRARLEAIRGGHEIGGQLPDRGAAIREGIKIRIASAAEAAQEKAAALRAKFADRLTQLPWEGHRDWLANFPPGPIDPSWGVDAPITPELPIFIPLEPEEPGQGLPAAGERPEQLPEDGHQAGQLPDVDGEAPPADPPPGTIWPPLPPGAPRMKKAAFLAFIPGIGLRYLVVDLSEVPEQVTDAAAAAPRPGGLPHR